MTLLIYTGHLIVSRKYNVKEFDVLDIWLGWREKKNCIQNFGRETCWKEARYVKDRLDGW